MNAINDENSKMIRVIEEQLKAKDIHISDLKTIEVELKAKEKTIAILQRNIERI
jgi:hypothetical protein